MMSRQLPPLVIFLLLLAHNSFGFLLPRIVVSNHHSPPSRRLSFLAGTATNDLNAVGVALTREKGKNDKLKRALLSLNNNSRLRPIELPCIAHADGPDYHRLADALQSQHWDYVAVTSPEAAKVLSSAWKTVYGTTHNPTTTASLSPPSICAVGKATENVLKDLGMTVAFLPSKATAKTLAQELPVLSKNGCCKVLYPASVRAKTTLQEGLQRRSFEVTRLDTYDTVTAQWSDDQRQLLKNSNIDIACFASPSAIKGWLQNTNNNTKVLAACIGETSAKACRDYGWSEETIFYPNKPGLEGWIAAVDDALEALSIAHHST